MRADLHLHTYYSDGMYSPAEIVTCAKQNGLKLIAVTDHDTALGYCEVKAYCKKADINTVCGIEVSAYDGDTKIHVLGYNINPDKSEYARFTEELYEGSLVRTEDILNKLNNTGVRISLDEVLEQRKCALAPIHAMYIARAAAKKGYAGTPFSFYSNYMNNGKPAFSNLCRPTPEQAVQFIHACGGIASLAHPDRIELEEEQLLALIKRLKAEGLDGIEAVYSTHTPLKTAYYKETAKAYDLLITGGSDAHYPNGSKKVGTPVFCADDKLLHALRI